MHRAASAALRSLCVFAVAADDVLIEGNLAVVVGTFEETLNPRTGPSSVLRGRYILVWQRQTDGSWKIKRGIGTDWQDHGA
jgi:ketosteroid isomerase-like protein